MQQLLLLLFICTGLFSNPAKSQDEIFFRKMFTGELRDKHTRPKPIKDNKYWIRSDAHQFDLNDDGLLESIIVSKADGKDYFEIRDANGVELFRYKLRPLGWKSSLYRINVKSLNKTTRVFVLHFFEGYVDYINFEGSARMYFLTLEGRDLNNLAMSEGPSTFFEQEKLNYDYIKKPYQVKVLDLNKDGTKEVMVESNLIKRVYFYLGKGKWQAL